MFYNYGLDCFDATSSCNNSGNEQAGKNRRCDKKKTGKDRQEANQALILRQRTHEGNKFVLESSVTERFCTSWLPLAGLVPLEERLCLDQARIVFRESDINFDYRY